MKQQHSQIFPLTAGDVTRETILRNIPCWGDRGVLGPACRARFPGCAAARPVEGAASLLRVIGLPYTSHTGDTMTHIQPRPCQLTSPMPSGRYKPFVPHKLPDRTWPDKTLGDAPRWLSTDLRDGNQALVDPMTPARKMRMFELLVGMGYKEIEIGFPSASQTDFDFVRQVIESGIVPDDVTISVLTQAREDLIERTMQSLVGAHRATIHMYNAVAELFRRVVFNIDEKQCIDLAHRGTEWVVRYADKYLGDVEFGYEYSPEIFSQTRTDFAIEVCHSVMDVWQPGPGREIRSLICRLPSRWALRTPTPTKSSTSAAISVIVSTCASLCTRTMIVARRLRPPSSRR